MNEITEGLAARIRGAEKDLLTTAVRQDARRLRELLHPDLVEIGRSGRLWTRTDLLVDLVEEPPRETPDTDEWNVHRLDTNTVLVTYRVTSGPRVSRHASIWDISADAPTLRFHQGTDLSDGTRP
ncbi:nuclear transport factor 2 family protein [Microbacterium oleivorans]|uniref:Nuclear transport factor 2 family protein n=1 Tax=Microbacterium oleivorans TaxID=273677 RepID=A0A7D5FAZ4_9MICO|nr:nuclear transport factor 2 family protein [Microbacterium oleivorans]QLD13109.1 nuclear transport factor 2 family protein [Microbacterium oleivorans]